MKKHSTVTSLKAFDQNGTAVTLLKIEHYHVHEPPIDGKQRGAGESYVIEGTLESISRSSEGVFETIGGQRRFTLER
ncbi:MAG TPA: hypothetical protein VNC50_19740 [Planctomycetia bacterium]|nr:hypothetical protein [Planctomycetia bacterium]